MPRGVERPLTELDRLVCAEIRAEIARRNLSRVDIEQMAAIGKPELESPGT